MLVIENSHFRHVALQGTWLRFNIWDSKNDKTRARRGLQGKSMTVFYAVLVKPFVGFVIITLAAMLAWPIRRLIQQRMSESRLKRLLLFSWRA